MLLGILSPFLWVLWIFWVLWVYSAESVLFLLSPINRELGKKNVLWLSSNIGIFTCFTLILCLLDIGKIPMADKAGSKVTLNAQICTMASLWKNWLDHFVPDRGISASTNQSRIRRKKWFVSFFQHWNFYIWDTVTSAAPALLLLWQKKARPLVWVCGVCRHYQMGGRKNFNREATNASLVTLTNMLCWL